MFPTETLLADSQGALIQRLCFPILSLASGESHYAVEAGPHVGMAVPNSRSRIVRARFISGSTSLSFP